MLARPVSVLQWGKVMDARKGKEVHALSAVSFIISTAIAELGKQLLKMPSHLFKMKWQWKAREDTIASLKPFHFLTEEDYQVGLESTNSKKKYVFFFGQKSIFMIKCQNV